MYGNKLFTKLFFLLLLHALIYKVNGVWQHYIVNVQLDKEHVSEGLETTGLPDGILSMPEFLLEYCSALVRPVSILYVVS